YKATYLLPAIGDFQRYRVLESLNYVGTELHKNCSPLFNPNIPEELKETVFRPFLKKRFDFIEKKLQNNKYLTGEHFMLPDSYLFVVLTWLPRLKIDITEWPNVAKYYDTLKVRDSIKKAIHQQHEFDLVK
ncbi:MAG: glutathione S-transferase family protein, partial [Gammaproteobacteria bacterium]|nr:glutathione S-transferase family protein [Gammaproteobacteria bacterium]